MNAARKKTTAKKTTSKKTSTSSTKKKTTKKDSSKTSAAEPMVGSHLSIAGGLHNALIEAQQLNMPCVQVFTKNQRQWRVPRLTDEQIREWQSYRESTGIEMVVSHDSYLINLASPKPEVYEKSASLFRDELLRCEALDIPYLVTHPGAHLGEGEEAGLKKVAASLDAIHDDLPGLKTVTCLEITAGQGTSLGHRFEHLHTIRDLVQQPERLAICLDTAHLIAAGYDLTSKTGWKDTMAELEAIAGPNLVRVIHMNDSKTPRGSKVDRHEHIGHGHVDLSVFEEIMNDKRFETVPKILETAKEINPDTDETWDKTNVAVLKGLLA